MCRIYNTIGSLADIQHKLVSNNLDEFHSLDELVDFKDRYEAIKHNLVSEHNQLIADEKTGLAETILAIKDNVAQRKIAINLKAQQQIQLLYDKCENLFEPNAKAIPLVIDCFKNLAVWIKIWGIQAWAAIYYSAIFLNSKRLLYKKRRRLNFLDLNFEKAVSQSISKPLQFLEKKRTIISEVNSSIYGALGEQDVVNELKALPDEFILINNFTCTFHPAIFHRKNDYIKSVQIDHILVAPSGIFLIETKNWSWESIKQQIYRSPIDQIWRAHLALLTILTNAKSKSIIRFKKYPWGNKTVPIRNIVVFRKAKLRDEFDFVKILDITQLLSYIGKFSAAFNSIEIEKIARYLLSISKSRSIYSKLTL